MLDVKKMLTKITQSVGVHFGESSSVTLPFTAQKDGIITIGVSPLSNANAYFIISDGSNTVYRSNMFYGFGTVGQFFVKKGKTYTVVTQDGVRDTNVTFSPLEIGGVLLKGSIFKALRSFSYEWGCC